MAACDLFVKPNINRLCSSHSIRHAVLYNIYIYAIQVYNYGLFNNLRTRKMPQSDVIVYVTSADSHIFKEVGTTSQS
jgi:hypothetical protein